MTAPEPVRPAVTDPARDAAPAARPRPLSRPPAVAGQFYPADPRELAATVDRLLDGVGAAGAAIAAGPDARTRAFVVPHAGYRYSGPTAAHAYARLRPLRDRVRRVVIVGPAHRVPLRGCAVPVTRSWRTPLGEVPIDPAVDALVAAGLAVADDYPHAPEHSLEVQLPFLQRVLHAPDGASKGAPDDASGVATGRPVPILPVVVGVSEPQQVADLIAAAVDPGRTVDADGTADPDRAVDGDRAGTIVLCSTDLSHYQPDDVARKQDERTAGAILDLDSDRIGVRDACGVFALRGLLVWAARAGLVPRLLRLATSAETGGPRDRVVGYPAFAFDAPAP